MALWVANRKVYGAHKLWKAARRAGHDIGRDQTARLMRLMAIRGVTRRRRVFTTRPDPDAVRAADLVDRDFTADRPDALWVTDLTYVPTRSGMAYVCFIVDAFSRRIVGWRVAAPMRTALVLLFLLALAALPGALLPQRSLNAAKVDEYRAQHSTLGPVLDRLGAFDVFAAPWFAAIYLLLFTSLVGCLVPRLRDHVRGLRSVPPAVPARLQRLAPPATADAAGRFAEVGLIDDRAFAEAWVGSRHAGRGLARRALAAELRRRGVDGETVGEAVAPRAPATEDASARQPGGEPRPGTAPPPSSTAGTASPSLRR